MKYFNIYKKRVNRFGEDYQSRVQGQREKVFDNLLLKSIYRVDFEFEGQNIEGILEKYKQDDTQTLQYLLTRIDVSIPSGTILMIPNKDEELTPWMIYYLEEIKASGYNRYIVLKMTHYLTWTARDGSPQSSWAYMFGPQSGSIKDTIKSSSTTVLYSENQNSFFFVLPVNPNLNKEDYFIIKDGDIVEHYIVTGYDRQSTKGVEFITVDPTYEKDLTPAPSKTNDDSDEEFYWLDGGK